MLGERTPDDGKHMSDMKGKGEDATQCRQNQNQVFPYKLEMRENNHGKLMATLYGQLHLIAPLL